PYFAEFTRRWPSVHDLAVAELDAVLTAWAGLGYYARARNLHKCADVVSRGLGGRFPETEEALRSLPGVGAYTAAAIAAIAFDRKATVVDGNVERVMARVFAMEEPLPGAKARLRALADTLTPDARPGDYAQAVMDLGATVCTPRNPKCILCPWQEPCAARRLGIADELPRKTARGDKPTRFGTAFWLTDGRGAVWLRRRPEAGLLGGMMEVPSTEWSETGRGPLTSAAPLDIGWRPLPGVVRHTFSHFHLELEVVSGKAGDGWRGSDGVWVDLGRLGEVALPTVMRKVVAHALARM
ncbi:MAG TPA: A/G-specific adenine glycosylase, partial [Azospirillaceae bacterium]|nr:A/G-specific adenine glycosylase [Azospirillaceae bacterium]